MTVSAALVAATGALGLVAARAQHQAVEQRRIPAMAQLAAMPAGGGRRYTLLAHVAERLGGPGGCLSFGAMRCVFVAELDTS
jgi:hypothetical protein